MIFLKEPSEEVPCFLSQLNPPYHCRSCRQQSQYFVQWQFQVTLTTSTPYLTTFVAETNISLTVQSLHIMDRVHYGPKARKAQIIFLFIFATIDKEHKHLIIWQ